MVDFIKEIVQKAKDGAFVSVDNHLDIKPIKYILGGIVSIKKNWIVYYPAFPSGSSDWHDSIATGFYVVDKYTISFTDQYGRTISITSFEDFHNEEKKEHRNWVKLAKEIEYDKRIPVFVKERLNLPSDFIGAIEI